MTTITPPISSEPQHGDAHAARLTPGKLAIWIFLVTEVMFFTGLIGSYIVLRAGSPPNAYSNLFAPGTFLADKAGSVGLVVTDRGVRHEELAAAVAGFGSGSAADWEHRLEVLPALVSVESSENSAQAKSRRSQLEGIGAQVEAVPLKTYNWPPPDDELVNPLNIDLTALNTFFLICSSVTMVLALSSIQRGNRARLSLYLLATIAIGSLFLAIQVYEYYQLIVGHHHSSGVSATGHFRASSSLFASCFFTMTGFHGAHVAAGVITLICVFLGSLFGRYTAESHAPVELAGLYWHFVDLVWIILFTIVYLI